MLWRSGYSIRILTGDFLPSGSIRLLNGSKEPLGPVVVGGFSLLALGEMEVWRRLLSEALPGFSVQYALFGAVGDLESAIPPSRHGSYGVVSDPGDLGERLEIDRVERSFAIQPGLAMVGAPTEEAWDQFREALLKRFVNG
ncbi:MAG: hypothetical protein ACOYON_11760 [Fimbriimonas sp.]